MGNVLNNESVNNQIVGALVDDGIRSAQQELSNRLVDIQQVAIERMQYAETALEESMNCIENIRDFAANTDNILGSMKTKHGEIAEQIEVGIRNGRSILKHLEPNATIDPTIVGRTAPEDYLIEGIKVQSKFIAGAGKSLDAVMGHMDKYPNFTENGYYHIPKDQFELIRKVASNESLEGVSTRTINKCRSAIAQIESTSGKPFSEVVRPGISTYNDVQLGTVDRTLDGYEDEFRKTNAAEVKEIRQETREQRAEAQHITDPSWGEAAKYGAVAFAIGGGVSASLKIYSKISSGKKITHFSMDDWKDVGYDFVKGGAKGAISGLGIYGLTKLAKFSAPLAGATVTTAMGIASLVYDYRGGKITKNEMSESACALSVEAGISSLGAIVGQTLIPIPVAGAIIGTVTAKAALEITKYVCGKNERKLIEGMQQEYNNLVAELNDECKLIIEKINDYYTRLGGYIEAAMSVESAARFYGSIDLCRFLNVPECNIIHNIDELDIFMN